MIEISLKREDLILLYTFAVTRHYSTFIGVNFHYDKLTLNDPLYFSELEEIMESLDIKWRNVAHSK